MLDAEQHKGSKTTVPDRFKQLFRCPYPRTSYYNARTIWLRAGYDLQKQFIDAGRTSDGTWEAFKRAVQDIPSPSTEESTLTVSGGTN